MFVKPETNLVSANSPIEVEIVSNKSCMRGKSASFVHHIEFDLGGTPLEGRFKPGQSIGIIPPGTDEHGRAHGARLYSVSSPSIGEDGQGRIVSTTCKRLIDEYADEIDGEKSPTNGLHIGVCSNYLCSLKPGDGVRVSGPSGKKFVLPNDVDDHAYVFVATGTGIAPFRGMVKELLHGPNGPIERPIHVVMGVPYATDLLYDEFFDSVARQHENFHYHRVISREGGEQSISSGYVHDYFARQPSIGRDVLRDAHTLLYLCGVKGMQVGIYQYLASNGLTDGYLRIPTNLLDKAPEEWTALDVRRIRPQDRCLVEVY